MRWTGRAGHGALLFVWVGGNVTKTPGRPARRRGATRRRHSRRRGRHRVAQADEAVWVMVDITWSSGWAEAFKIVNHHQKFALLSAAASSCIHRIGSCSLRLVNRSIDHLIIHIYAHLSPSPTPPSPHILPLSRPDPSSRLSVSRSPHSLTRPSSSLLVHTFQS